MSIAKFTIGRRGASGKHASYITRDGACDSISFHNLDELQGDNEFENKVNAISYAYNREEEELEQNGNGRTHYRMILSWEGKEDSDKAREMTHEYLQENFKDSRAVVAVHQDTDQTHAHIWIDARQTDERKLHIQTRDYKKLDERWTQQYDRAYGTEYAKDYAAKKEQTRQWKRDRAAERQQGKKELPKDKPERYRDDLDSGFFRQKEAKDRGAVRSDESRARGSQQPFEVRSGRAETGEHAVVDSQQRLAESERSFNRATEQADKTESAARNLGKEFERVAERQRGINERGDLER